MQDPIKPLPAPSQKFSNGNPASGELGSIVNADWLNSMQDSMQTTQSALQSAQQELVSVIQNSGQKTDSNRQDQLLQAVQNIAWGGTQKPTTLAGYGIADGASKSDLKTAIDGVVAGAPGALNTLQELAAALGNDSNFAASIAKLLAGKADKASTLAGYGISDGATATQVNAAAPVGMVAYFAMKDAPAGWLVADGKSYSCKDYPALGAVLNSTYDVVGATTFTVPNLCGEFIRGWDRGRGVDINRKIGSTQISSQILVDDDGLQTVGAIDWSSNDLVALGYEVAQASGVNLHFVNSTTTSCPSASGFIRSIRPRNVALLACIKC
ncbi:phage tail protein [Chromobacterium sp. IIBBL 290-4]|uniref:phage tail protein n=1 Tax=Chromobacterium sp. IIBBL 290-4 TaxID=2953890 RepID=UPI0020B66BF2|nr:phage tail protein [Chromobacterium sp. IIBBL 290-4]UTH76014.1 tail fiber protein [Chromobacterium sp. IIBBL 290-4]